MIEVVQDEFATDLKPRWKAQELFTALPDEIFEVLYGGAAGGGKSFCLVNYPLFMKCHQIYGFRGKIFRRSFPQINDSLVPESKRWYPRFGYEYNAGNHTWVNKKYNSEISFGFLERMEDVLRHDSAQYHYLAFEELTEFPQDFYLYLLHRCRSDIAGWRARCRNAATPGNIGNSWVRKRFVEPAPNGFKVIDAFHGKSNIKRMFIPSRADDNVVLSARDPDYYARLDMLPEALKKAKKYGDWYAFQGAVFEEFRTVQLTDEPTNALHVIDPRDVDQMKLAGVPSEIPSWWPKIIAIDWGFRHDTWVGWGAISPRGELLIYRERVYSFTPIKIWAAEVRKLSQFDGNIAAAVIDPSANQNRGQDKTIFDEVSEALKMKLELADNDRIGGKMLIHELLRWVERPVSREPQEGFDLDTYNTILRIKGEAVARSYAANYIAEDVSETLPKVRIFNTCSALINALQNAVYAEDSSGKKVEDVKKVDGDDPYDGFRYLAKKYEYFTVHARRAFEERSARGNVLEQFQKDGDYHAFYQRMEHLESVARKEPLRLTRGPIRKHTRVISH